MELKKLKEHWDGFPSLSMEERPVMTSEMESMLVKNPFISDFYLKNKILIKIGAGIVLLAIDLFRTRSAFRNGEGEAWALFSLALTLTWFIVYHVQLLLYAGYDSLITLNLSPFLSRIEGIFDKYIHSFKITSLLAGFYCQFLIEWLVRINNPRIHDLVWQNNTWRMIFIIFLSITAYIILLPLRINRYKKLMIAVRSYKAAIPGPGKRL